MKFVRQITNKLTENNRILLNNSVGALVVKGAGLLVSLISTPAFIHYFGDHTVLGVWYTILSMITWIDFFDLGIGNGLRNSLTKSFAQQNWTAAKELISSAYVIIGILSVVLIGAGNVLVGVINWNEVLNISEEILAENILETAIQRVYIGVVLHFFLKLISSVIYAMQKSALNNLISLLGSVLRLVFVLVTPRSNPEANLLAIANAYAFLACVPYLVATIGIFSQKLRSVSPSLRYCRRDAVAQVMGIGGVFFACQILYMLLINTNDICITYFTGPENTTEYNIYYKLFSVVGTLAQLALTPVWSMVTKAIYEKSYNWLRSLYCKIMKLTIPVALVQFLLVIILQFAVNLWLGDATIQVNYGYATVFALWGTVFTVQNCLSTFVCGLGKMKLQMICYSAGVILKFVLLWIIYQMADQWIIVVAVNILVMVPYCIAQHRQLFSYLKSLGDT